MTRSLLIIIVSGLWMVAWTRVSLSPGNVQRSSDPFSQVGRLMTRIGSGGRLDGFDTEEVTRAVGTLAKSQAALKSVDGLTHQFRNVVKERYQKFMASKRKKLKEAAKVYEYTTAVERGMQAAEILQAAASRNASLRRALCSDAGLKEEKRVTVSEGKLKVTVTVLRPFSNSTAAASPEDGSSTAQPASAQGKRSRSQAALERMEKSRPVAYRKGEIVIAVTEEGGQEELAVARLLRVLSKGTPLQLGEAGLVVQPTLWRLATKALQAVRECVDEAAVATDSAEPGTLNRRNNSSTASAAGDVDPAGIPGPQYVRLVGSSTGGAVAALMAVVLDGGLLSSPGKPVIPDGSDGATDDPPSSVGSAAQHGSTVPRLATEAENITGTFAGHVQCLALGPPPCLNRATVPRYVTSFVCGDDVVPRAHPAALRSLNKRVLAALEAGAGRRNSLGYMLGTGLVQDLSKIAGKSIGRYRGAKKVDPSALGLPGRVFFIKPRKLKTGATIQRVLRGNWQEDTLWQLHDVLISQRMLEHHALDSYIRTLNRC